MFAAKNRTTVCRVRCVQNGHDKSASRNGKWGNPGSWVTSFHKSLSRAKYINKHESLQNYSSEFRAKVHENGATSDNNFGTIV